ncbi:hypothetical protein MRA01_04530 [Methylobacterium radiotolerans]|nr:hypothetical protein MRA01_04530 [Methylobacterium radiotolerans]
MLSVNNFCLYFGILCFAAVAGLAIRSREDGWNWATIIALITLMAAGSQLLYARVLIPKNCNPSDLSQSFECVKDRF